jgi:hypothetical protein
MPENFEGHAERECGEHRATIRRAWCFDCSEWCYPHCGCKGCELPTLRKQLKEVREHCLDVVSGYSEINSEYDQGNASGRDSVAEHILSIIGREE